MAARKLEVTFVGDTKQLEGAFRRVQGQADDFGGKMKHLGGRMGETGKRATRNLTLPIVGLGAAALKAGGDFQSSMNRVGALSGATGKDLDRLRKQARDLGSTTQYSASEAADAMGFLAMAGFENQQIFKAMPATLSLAAAGQTELAETADIASNILTGYGIEADKLTDVSDKLTKTFTKSNTDLSQLGEAFKYVAPVAKGAGIEFDQTAAALGLLGNAGIQGSMAGTTLRGIITKLQNPTKAAAETMGALGLSVTDAAGELKPLDKIIQEFEKSGASSADMMAIFGQRAGPGMVALVDQGSKSLVKFSDEIANSGGTADRIAKQQMKGLNGGLKGLKSAAESLAISLSESGLLGAMTGMVEKLTAFTRKLSDTNPAVLKLLGIVAGLVAVFGPVLIVLGKIVSAIGVVGGAAVKLGGALVLLATRAKSLWLAARILMLGLGGPVVLAIGAVIAAGVLLYKNWDTVTAALKKAWDWMKKAAADAFGAVTGAVTAAWGAVSSATTATWGAITSATSTAWNAIRSVVDTVLGVIRTIVVGYFTGYRLLIEGVWKVVRTVTTTAWNGIREALKVAWEAIATLVRSYFAVYKAIVTGAWTAISTATKALWEGIRTTLSAVWGGIRSTATATWDGVKSAVVTPVRSAVKVVGGAFEGLAKTLGAVWDRIRDGISDFAGSVKKGVTGALKGGLGIIAKLALKILEVVGIIPGVGTKGPQSKIKGWAKDLDLPGFARGGVVNAPMFMVGEEGPAHPEFIIPTNPAYRGRAISLLGQAAGELGIPGFAEGGVVSGFRRATKATGAGPKSALALWMAGIVESGLRNLNYGDRDSRGALQIRDSTARGMGVNNMDPFASAMAFLTRGFWGRGGAISLSSRTNNSAGWVAQQVQGSAFPGRYDQVRGQAAKYVLGKGAGGGGIGGALSSVGGALSGLAGEALDLVTMGPKFLLDKLPKPDLPDWMKGLGPWVMDRVEKFIREKVGSLIPGGGGPGGEGGLGGLNPDGGLQGLMGLARNMGLTITSTTGGKHAAGSLHYQGRAFDASNSSGPTPQMEKFARTIAATVGTKLTEMFYDPLGWSIKHGKKVPWTVGGHRNHVHVGMAQGGVAPGGWVRVGELGPEWAQLPEGSRVRQASESAGGPPGSGPMIGEVHIHNQADERVLARELAWAMTTA